ncbi:hypothetical protein ACFH04_13445 [Streptomyces noboritoensis]|uniref:Uncharacterized protein n=1 Tax=Streptomyces noboritoensis TaxID=67337 RepID=A0ABV6TFY3_9ACTN
MTTDGQPLPGVLLSTELIHALLGGALPPCSTDTGEAAAVAAMIRDAARELDSVQEQLQARAGYVIDQLRRITEGRDRTRRGSTDGVLQLAGVQVDMLAARRGDAVRHLSTLCTAYQALRHPSAVPAEPSRPAVAPGSSPARPARRR